MMLNPRNHSDRVTLVNNLHGWATAFPVSFRLKRLRPQQLLLGIVLHASIYTVTLGDAAPLSRLEIMAVLKYLSLCNRFEFHF